MHTHAASLNTRDTPPVLGKDGALQRAARVSASLLAQGRAGNTLSSGGGEKKGWGKKFPKDFEVSLRSGREGEGGQNTGMSGNAGTKGTRGLLTQL